MIKKEEKGIVQSILFSECEETSNEENEIAEIIKTGNKKIVSKKFMRIIIFGEIVHIV